ncbi:MAG TPA: zf-HC2 domain-containing protein [Candidatus Binatia bacterium]|nr:zf-HC2 domain-containing protein [Candidatus Binatia bacterium]
MSNGTACPEESLFSQFLDRELEAAEEKWIAHHLTTCPDCRARVVGMEKAAGIARTQLPGLRRRSSLPTLSSPCPSPETVTAYMQGLLVTEDDLQIEQHLQACDACLQDAQEAARVSYFLSSPREAPVPAPLRAQMAGLWENSLAKADTQSLPRLVIQMVERGLRLIESYLAPPLLAVQEVLAPPTAFRGAAYRSGDSAAALNLRLSAEEAEIAVLATPEEDGVTVTLTLLDTDRKALTDQRIFLRQQGRAIFSARTDHQGVVRVPRLKPGSYEVACDEIHTPFHLELRP